MAQGARTERVVCVGVGGMVMLVPRARWVVVVVGMVVLVIMGMAAHR